MEYKVVIVGCGSMSGRWVDYALSRTDTEIVALVDIALENAQAVMERHHFNVPIFNNVKEAIASTGANLVFNVTIPDAHAQVVLDSFALGCHVFGEKPMAASLEESKQLVEAAKQSGKTYAVMQNRRYNKQIKALRDMIDADTIGQVGFINADFFLGPHFGGFREVMDSPLILDMAIHTFDQARYITGADPVSVYCHEFNPAGSWYKGNAAAVCIFEFNDGSVFCYRGSWCAEGAPTAWESSWRINGSKGTAIWDGEHVPYAEVVESDPNGFMNQAKKEEAEIAWEGREDHEGCLDEMFAALAESRKPQTDCTDNIKTMAMVFGAMESAKTGKKVQISV